MSRSKTKSKSKRNQSYLIGINSISATLQRDPSRILQIFLRSDGPNNERLNALEQQANTFGIAVSHQNKDFFENHFSGNHQGVAAEVKTAKQLGDKDFKQWLTTLPECPLLLILDQIQDPHNLGAILRTADAVGVDAIIVNDKNAAPMNETVSKIASGAAESVLLFRVGNLVRAIEQLKEQGVWIAGTTDHAQQTIYEQNVDGPLALIMGSEGSGMRRLTEENCDLLVKLPMDGLVSSLNVSVATGVCLYEIKRQRSLKYV